MRSVLAALCLLCATSAGAAGIDLRAPDEIADLLAPHLPDEPGSTLRLESLMAGILATEGYFSPRIVATGEGDGMRLEVDPGPRTLVEAVTVAVDGPLATETRAALLGAWGLPAGRPFRQEDWSAAKQALLAKLLAHDFAGARLIDSEAAIEPEARSASLSVRYDSGPRYRFGDLRVSGLERYPESLVGRYNRSVLPGMPYEEERLNTLQANLQASPYFAAVQVGIERDEASVDGEGRQVVPVSVRVRERPAHRLSFGAGYSSNTGARVEAAYHTPNLFNRAWVMDTGVRLEQKQQAVYADVFMPPADDQWRNGFGISALASDIEGLKRERIAIGGQRVRLRDRLETRYSLTWQDEKLDPAGAPESRAAALVPNVALTWRQVDNPLDPRRGIVLQGQAGGGSKAALSDQNFVRLSARAQVFLPVGAIDTLTLRGEAGWTLADSRVGIPQDYLFRTGGTGSVRGYDYLSLGVPEGSAIVGGRYMTTASIEYTHWFTHDWGAAAFVDAGDAVDSLGDVRLAVGYGLGARWRSPAGPIAVDVAYGERTGNFNLHFSLAIPF
ncbi:MAG: outer membrane protein assembly factor [Betaproteobacteria bacterium]|nr:outer membrane protein assembly factor [Betaproteobacteria bacterium]